MMKPWDCWPVDEGRGDYRTVYALDEEGAAEAFLRKYDHLGGGGVTDEMRVCVARASSLDVTTWTVCSEMSVHYHAKRAP